MQVGDLVRYNYDSIWIGRIVATGETMYKVAWNENLVHGNVIEWVPKRALELING